jgi:ketol-acid reductoisomerase
MMRLTIIGFGNQAKSWAQNLRDSGFPVLIALQPGSLSRPEAKKMGFHTVDIGTPEFYLENAFALLTPDHTHSAFIAKHANHIRPQSLMIYAHGFSVGEGQINLKFPLLQHILFAPKAIGSEVRNQFLLKGKLGAVYSLEHVHSNRAEIETWVLDLSRALGVNIGPFRTTFERETKADLFSEQALLCSLIPYTADLMFENLIQSGVEPELAYLECWHELKLIMNAMIEKGPGNFFEMISPNALIGSEKGFHRIMNAEFRKNVRSLLEEIEIGQFNNELKESSVDEHRKLIRDRWAKSKLNQTFIDLNQEAP